MFNVCLWLVGVKMVMKSHSFRLPVLMKTCKSTQVSLKDYSVRFHEYPSSWSRVDTRGQTLTKVTALQLLL
jgi:hypothetical protein